MSDPAALLAVPDQIRALRAFVKEHASSDASARCCAIIVDSWLLGAELSAECLVDALPAEHRLCRPPQQIHAPIADQVEPLVPRRTGHDARLPLGRPHP